MPTDTQIRHGTHAMLDAIPVPVVPFAAIQRRIQLRRSAAGRESTPNRRPIIAAAIALVILPAAALAVVSYETRSRASLQAHGGWAPPPPPPGFVSKLQPKAVTLSQAQSGVEFSLTAPSGLPAGTSLAQIDMGPVGLYDGNTHTWRTGPNELTFRYRLASRRSFDVLVRRYDGNDLPGRYLFEDRGPDAEGNPQLVKRENFAWRNGDQMTVVTAGTAVDKQKILAMARSMKGALLRLPWPSPHTHGTLRVIVP